MAIPIFNHFIAKIDPLLHDSWLFNKKTMEQDSQNNSDIGSGEHVERTEDIDCSCHTETADEVNKNTKVCPVHCGGESPSETKGSPSNPATNCDMDTESNQHKTDIEGGPPLSSNTDEERTQSDPSSHTAAEEDAAAEEKSIDNPEPVDIKIIYNKQKYDHTADMQQTILQLKQDIEKLTGVPVATQKVMYKGSTQDDQTLSELKVTKNAKFMVIGSTMNDLLKVAAPGPKEVKSTSDLGSSASGKEPLCKQTVHKKVLDKHGKPEDVPAGIKDTKLPLPPTPLTGMYNKYGNKTRLTFKLDQDELWIGTKERTQKVKMGSIKTVSSEAIEGHEEYHIMGLQLGPTEISNYWIYWVPAQYVKAIKDTILGKWDFF